MENLTIIILTLSQSLTQAQETILVLSKQLQALQVHTKVKTPPIKITTLYQKTKNSKLKCYWLTHGRTRRLYHTSATYNFPKTVHQLGATFGDKMGGIEKWYEEDKAREYDGGARNTLVEKINYNHHLSLIQTLPTISTQFPPQPQTNDPVADSGCTGHYLYDLTKSTVASIHQAQIPLKKISSQAKHAEIFPKLHSSLISLDNYVTMNI